MHKLIYRHSIIVTQMRLLMLFHRDPIWVTTTQRTSKELHSSSIRNPTFEESWLMHSMRKSTPGLNYTNDPLSKSLQYIQIHTITLESLLLSEIFYKLIAKLHLDPINH